MKKLNVYSLFLALCFVLSFTSCSKEGDMGPEGPKGDKGDKGEMGSQGIPGTDGNLLLYGTEAPADTDGNTGDYYIDSQNYTLYGPKTDDGWGTPINLKGADGQDGSNGQDGQDGADGNDGVDGQDGNTLLSGMEVPNASIGVNGDFYFHITTVSIYGPKTDSGWGNAVSLKGDQGDAGTANVTATKWFTGTNIAYASASGRGIADYELQGEALDALLGTGATSLNDFLANKGGTLIAYAADTSLHMGNVVVTSSGRTVVKLPGYVRIKYQVTDEEVYTFRVNGEWRVDPQEEQRNKIRIGYTYSHSLLTDDEGPAPTNPPKISMRFILIPAGQYVTSAKGVVKDDINWEGMSYEEVKELLNLED